MNEPQNEQSHPAENQTSAASIIETNYLIIGAGPAGASLAAFLSYHGLEGLMVSAAPSTAETPRAHITNMGALECLRDIGLEDECIKLGNTGSCMKHSLWCRSLMGEELARLHAWGYPPQRMGDYESASPCTHMDLPQTLLEPILTRYATQHGFNLRFNMIYRSHTQGLTPGKVTTTLEDAVTHCTHKVVSKYLFAADGGRSLIARHLELPMVTEPGSGTAINVLARVDLTQAMEHRQGNLHFILRPDKPHSKFGWQSIARMIQPWTEWMFILFPTPTFDSGANLPHAEYADHIRDLIGDRTIAIDIHGVSKWTINETYAETYQDERVFLLGDAVHRHPPMNGLGSNTCIQDAYNLAWKVAYVDKGLAPLDLLDTYTEERQPVGKAIVTRANEAFVEGYKIWDVLGFVNNDPVKAAETMEMLKAPTAAGASLRKQFQDAIRTTRREFQGLGIEMSQVYESFACVADSYTGDKHSLAEAIIDPETPTTHLDAEDPVLMYKPSTRPGHRLPHVWLNKIVPGKPMSTHDVTGKGRFTLLTGHGGGAWRTAVSQVRNELRIPIEVVSIGYGEDWVDVYSDWTRLRAVDESGCVLVRPDRFIAWRCKAVLGERECQTRLLNVLKDALGWTQP